MSPVPQATTGRPVSVSNVCAALTHITHDTDRDTWVSIGMAIKAALGDEGFGIWDDWSQGADSYDERDARSAWRSFKSQGRTTVATLFGIAQRNGYRTGSAAPAPAVQPLRAPPREADRPQHSTLSPYGRELWRSCGPIAGDALAYLQARNCVVPPADGDLRYHPALKHPPSGRVGPALVALITSALTGEPLTLQRVWVCADGCKASLDPPRMQLRDHRKAGGVIRLWPDDSVTHGLGIAEGTETALSLAHAYQPVWALIDAGNLASFPAISGIESLTIAADHDDAGIRAAQACADRWAAAGREVHIVVPEAHKTDLNDLARAA